MDLTKKFTNKTMYRFVKIFYKGGWLRNNEVILGGYLTENFAYK